MLAAVNLKRARERQPRKTTIEIPKFKVGDLVLLKNHKEQIWDTIYIPNLRIFKCINDRANDLQHPSGHV